MLRAFSFATLALALLSLPAMAQENASTISTEAAELVAVGDVSLGSADATIIVDEYASLSCVHCAAFSKEVFPAFKAKYIDTGLVRFTLKPLPSDPVAAGAFMVARCDTDGEYYPRLEHLFEVQDKWAFSSAAGDNLLSAMSIFGFDQEKFTSCLGKDEVLAWIIASQTHAVNDLGLKSTPTFVVNGKPYVGNMSIEALSDLIAPLLKQE